MAYIFFDLCFCLTGLWRLGRLRHFFIFLFLCCFCVISQVDFCLLSDFVYLCVFFCIFIEKCFRLKILWALVRVVPEKFLRVVSGVITEIFSSRKCG